MKKENDELKNNLSTFQTKQETQNNIFSKMDSSGGYVLKVVVFTLCFVLILGIIDFLIIMSLKKAWNRTKPANGPCQWSANNRNDIDTTWKEKDKVSNAEKVLAGDTIGDRITGATKLMTEDTGLKDTLIGIKDNVKRKIKNQVKKALSTDDEEKQTLST